MRDLNVLLAAGFAQKVKAPRFEEPVRFPYLLGVELELEHVYGPLRDAAPRGWVTHVDESLRNDGLEFVFRQPYAGNDALAVVDNFYNVNDHTYTRGARTSTHIHVDASQLTVGAMRAIVGLSYILEDALFASVADARRWCGYCMPLTEMSPSRMRTLLMSEDAASFSLYGLRSRANADKYYGLNVTSLLKHGTLEYRYFPGGPTKDQLLEWMDYCTELTSAGRVLEDYDAITALGTYDEFAALVRRLFPTWAARLLAGNTDKMMERLFDLQALTTAPYVEKQKRADPLIYVTPQLIGLAVRMFGRDKATRDHIAASMRGLEVMSRAEWSASITEPRIKKTKSAAGKAPVWDELLFNANDYTARRAINDHAIRQAQAQMREYAARFADPHPPQPEQEA